MVEVRAGCYLRCDWLQQRGTPHAIKPVPSFPHALPVTAPQPDNVLWRGFELAHAESSTNSCRFADKWRAAVAVAYVCGDPQDRRTLERHRRHATGVMTSVLLWPATVLCTHYPQWTAGQRCKCILAHDLTLITPALSQCRSNSLGC